MSRTLESMAVEVSKHFAGLYVVEDGKHKLSVLTLRKVCERALEDFRTAEFPGSDARPWLETRVRKFLGALSEKGDTVDRDLLPSGHPLRVRKEGDPWEELLGAEERLSALQKTLLSSIQRADVRKASDGDLVGMNRRLSHLFELHFGANALETGVTGIARKQVVEAAALVHEELARRGLFTGDEPFPREVCRKLYEEALALRAEPQVVMHDGEIVQHADGIELVVEGGRLFVAAKSVQKGVSLKSLGERFSPAGSVAHAPFLEPHEVTYTVRARELEEPGEVIGKFTYTKGAKTADFQELFVLGDLNGVLVVGKSQLMLRKSLLPYVLTPEAVAAKYMPPEGESALPGTLEWDVPPELRYWRSACGQDPREVRDQLVAMSLFTPDSVEFVDGAPRRTLTKRYVEEPYPAAPMVFAELQPETRTEALLFKAYFGSARSYADAVQAGQGTAEEGALRVAPEETGVGLVLADTAEDAGLLALRQGVASMLKYRYLVEAPDTLQARAVLKELGRVFVVPGVSGKVFVASHPVSHAVEWIDDVPDELEKCAVHLVKQSTAEEEHYVLGIVLEPDVVDAQNDTYSEEEVRKSAHRFMAFHQNAGLMHKTLINDSVHIVESYLCPVDCTVGGQAVKKGTWLLAMVIDDETLWSQVKSGELTGFSIGGSAIRVEEP